MAREMRGNFKVRGSMPHCFKLSRGGFDHATNCPDYPQVGAYSCPKFKNDRKKQMSIECAHCGNKIHDRGCPNHYLNRSEKEKMKEGNYDAVKDSGERREFATGSVRDVRSGKGRFDLIPPYSLLRLARHYENGAVKYGDRNWEKGQPIASYIDSMLRHGQDYLKGDRSEDHLAAVAWNAFAAMFTEELVRLGKLPAGFNDMPVRMEDRPDA